MKNADRATVAIAVSAALGLAAMSTGASAQPGDSQYCEEYAWSVCNPNHLPWTAWSFRCWNETFDNCMGSSLAVKQPDGDKRFEVRPAPRPETKARRD